MKNILLFIIFILCLTCQPGFTFDLNRVYTPNVDVIDKPEEARLSPAQVAEVPFVVKIEVTGNAHVPSSQILAKLATELGDGIQELKLERDALAIKSLGLFEDVKARYYEIPDGIVLVYDVVENPYVEKIEITGATVYNQDRLMKLLSIKTHELLNYDKVRKDKQALEALYHDGGYTMMQVVNVDQSPTDNGTLVFAIQEGRVEEIRVEGNKSTNEWVIRRELKLKPGDVFNYDTLGNDYRRVFGVDLFSRVEPKVMKGTAKDSSIIVWEVEEKRNNSLNLGGSFSSSMGGSLFVDLAFNNWNGNAEQVNIKGDWGGKQKTYQLKYSNPWIGTGPRTSLTTRLWSTDGAIDESSSGEALRTGGDVAVGRQLSEEWFGLVRTRYENVDGRGTVSDNRIFSLGGTISYDTRDIWMNPTKGWYNSVSVDNYNRMFGGTVDMTRYTMGVQYYYPLMDKQVLASRLTLSEIYGLVPDTERFYLGGGTTVRGFEDGYPFARGSRKILGSMEYRITFSDVFQGVVFYDFGHMSAVNYDRVNFEGSHLWRSGHGFGLRINSPLGPIRMDFGWTDAKGNRGVGQIWQGGAMHFSIGQAF